jgi:pilus assembly protein CpaF
MSDASAAQGLLNALSDPAVNEVMLNEDGTAYVERMGAGALEPLPFRLDAANAMAFLRALAGDGVEAFLAKRPFADLVAVEGSRVHVLMPPLVKGMTVTIRKRPTRRPTLEHIVEAGALTANCAGFLAYAVAARKNILLAGGTSSGKTTLLNSLCARIPNEERILVLEDTPELTLPQPHVNYLRTRLRDPQGGPDVTLHDLVVNTLRMRPDRVIVGEVRSVEAADMLEAMNVGCDGMMGTIHANSAREALQRLETLVLMAGGELPMKAVRMNIASALDLIVVVTRTADGKRRVMQVAEVTGMEVDAVTMIDIFKVEGRKGPGAMNFELKPTGSMPRFYDGLRQAGMEPPLEFFR